MQNLLVLKFIQEHPNDWEQILSAEPYHMSVKHYDGKELINQNLVMLSYNQIFSDFHNPIVRECRGIIIDKVTMKAVCVPFFKFGNQGESYADKIDWSTAHVLQKIDGSLIKLYFYNGTWRIATNGTINALECDLPSDLGPSKTFGELFLNNIPVDSFLDIADKDYTYMFEICSPWNRVVTPWQTTEIFFLGMRHNETLQETLPDDRFMPILPPKMYPLTSLAEVEAASKELPFQDEGYVVVDADFKRVKIKGPAYVKIHHLRSEGPFTMKRAFELVQANEVGEFLSYYPEYTNVVEGVRSKLDVIKEALKEQETLVFSQNFLSRKDYALFVKDFQYKSYFFSKLDGKVSGIDEYVSKLKFDQVQL